MPFKCTVMLRLILSASDLVACYSANNSCRLSFDQPTYHTFWLDVAWSAVVTRVSIGPRVYPIPGQVVPTILVPNCVSLQFFTFWYIIFAVCISTLSTSMLAAGWGSDKGGRGWSEGGINGRFLADRQRSVPNYLLVSLSLRHTSDQYDLLLWPTVTHFWTLRPTSDHYDLLLTTDTYYDPLPAI